MLLLLAITVETLGGDHVLLPCLTLRDEDLNHVLEEAGDGVDFEDADPGREVRLSAVNQNTEPVESCEEARQEGHAHKTAHQSVHFTVGKWKVHILLLLPVVRPPNKMRPERYKAVAEGQKCCKAADNKEKLPEIEIRAWKVILRS